VVAEPDSDREAQALLDRGQAQAAVRLLPGFARDIERGGGAQVQILINGTNSNTASLVASYAGQIVAQASADLLAAARNRQLLARGAAAPVFAGIPQAVARPRVWFNADLKSRNFFVPGVVANILMLVTLMLTALAIVREKEIGTMEQLLVTPVRPVEVMLGKTLPFAIIGMFQVAFMTTVALVVFRVPMRGSLLLLAGSSALFLLTTLGAGLFISTISQTQQQAMMSSFFFSIPAFMLSGFTFPIRNMPVAVQWLSYLNPLRYFMDIVRGVFLKGVGVDVLWPQLVALAVYGVTVLGLSAARFHKSLD
jgi:ABC-2 type transport system permease protein